MTVGDLVRMPWRAFDAAETLVRGAGSLPERAAGLEAELRVALALLAGVREDLGSVRANVEPGGHMAAMPANLASLDRRVATLQRQIEGLSAQVEEALDLIPGDEDDSGPIDRMKDALTAS